MKNKLPPSFYSNAVIAFLSAMCLILSLQFVLPPVSNEKPREFSSDWTYHTRGMPDSMPIDLPNSNIPNPSGEVITFTRQLPNDFVSGATLMFTTIHQTAEVYVDDSLLYTYGIGQTSPLGRSFGNAWHLVRLPSDYMSKTLTLKIKSPHQQYATHVEAVYFGTKSSHIMSLMDRYFWTTFIGAVMFIFGMAFKILYFIVYRLTRKSPVILYLSSFASLCGLWILSESQMLQFIVNAPIAISTISMISLILIPLPILYFFKSNYIFGEHKIFKIAIMIHRTFAITTIILHLIHLVDFLYILPILHILILIELSIAMYFSIKTLRKRVVRTMLFGLICLYVSVLVTGLLYYITPSMDVTTFSKWGMLLFTLVVGVDAGRHILSMSKNNVMNSALAQLAYTDTMTGLKNRASFQEHLDSYEKDPAALSKVSIAIADLNYLKKINDTYGHKKGDAIIVQCADFLASHFGKIGSVYRIGGDEFAIIIPEASNAQCNEAHTNFKRAVKLYNKTIPGGGPLSVAVGLEHFNRAYDNTITDLFNRADSSMYTNKVAIKEKTTSMFKSAEAHAKETPSN